MSQDANPSNRSRDLNANNQHILQISSPSVTPLNSYEIWSSHPEVFIEPLFLAAEYETDLSYKRFTQYYRASPIPALLASYALDQERLHTISPYALSLTYCGRCLTHVCSFPRYVYIVYFASLLHNLSLRLTYTDPVTWTPASEDMGDVDEHGSTTMRVPGLKQPSLSGRPIQFHTLPSHIATNTHMQRSVLILTPMAWQAWSAMFELSTKCTRALRKLVRLGGVDAGVRMSFTQQHDVLSSMAPLVGPWYDLYLCFSSLFVRGGLSVGLGDLPTPPALALTTAVRQPSHSSSAYRRPLTVTLPWLTGLRRWGGVSVWRGLNASGFLKREVDSLKRALAAHAALLLPSPAILPPRYAAVIDNSVTDTVVSFEQLDEEDEDASQLVSHRLLPLYTALHPHTHIQYTPPPPHVYPLLPCLASIPANQVCATAGQWWSNLASIPRTDAREINHITLTDSRVFDAQHTISHTHAQRDVTGGLAVPTTMAGCFGAVHPTLAAHVDSLRSPAFKQTVLSLDDSMSSSESVSGRSVLVNNMHDYTNTMTLDLLGRDEREVELLGPTTVFNTTSLGLSVDGRSEDDFSRHTQSQRHTLDDVGEAEDDYEAAMLGMGMDRDDDSGVGMLGIAVDVIKNTLRQYHVSLNTVTKSNIDTMGVEGSVVNRGSSCIHASTHAHQAQVNPYLPQLGVRVNGVVGLEQEVGLDINELSLCGLSEMTSTHKVASLVRDLTRLSVEGGESALLSDDDDAHSVVSRSLNPLSSTTEVRACLSTTTTPIPVSFPNVFLPRVLRVHAAQSFAYSQSTRVRPMGDITVHVIPDPGTDTLTRMPKFIRGKPKIPYDPLPEGDEESGDRQVADEVIDVSTLPVITQATNVLPNTSIWRADDAECITTNQAYLELPALRDDDEDEDEDDDDGASVTTTITTTTTASKRSRAVSLSSSSSSSSAAATDSELFAHVFAHRDPSHTQAFLYRWTCNASTWPDLRANKQQSGRRAMKVTADKAADRALREHANEQRRIAKEEREARKQEARHAKLFGHKAPVHRDDSDEEEEPGLGRRRVVMVNGVRTLTHSALDDEANFHRNRAELASPPPTTIPIATATTAPAKKVKVSRVSTITKDALENTLKKNKKEKQEKKDHPIVRRLKQQQQAKLQKEQQQRDQSDSSERESDEYSGNDDDDERPVKRERAPKKTTTKTTSATNPKPKPKPKPKVMSEPVPGVTRGRGRPRKTKPETDVLGAAQDVMSSLSMLLSPHEVPLAPSPSIEPSIPLTASKPKREKKKATETVEDRPPKKPRQSRTNNNNNNNNTTSNSINSRPEAVATNANNPTTLDDLVALMREAAEQISVTDVFDLTNE